MRLSLEEDLENQLIDQVHIDVHLCFTVGIFRKEGKNFTEGGKDIGHAKGFGKKWAVEFVGHDET